MPSKARILIVDDDKDFLNLISDKLKASGFAVMTAAGAQAGIEVALREHPDLILMDVEMPEKDGIQATTELHANPNAKNLKIVFLTNLGEAGPGDIQINRHFARQVGALDYIRKGVDLEVLIQKINAVLSGEGADFKVEPAD